MTVLPVLLFHKNLIAPAYTIHRGVAAFLPKKAGFQTFLHSQAPSRANTQWRVLARAKPNK
jgi:hypothetical protein